MKKFIYVHVCIAMFLFSTRSQAKQCWVGVHLADTGFSYSVAMLNTVNYDTLIPFGTFAQMPATLQVLEGVCNCFIASIEWYYEGALISNTDSCTISDTGSYMMHAQIDDCGIQSYFFYLRVGYDPYTMVDDLQSQSRPPVYPGTTKGMLQVNSFRKWKHLNIADVTGRILYNSTEVLSELHIKNSGHRLCIYAIVDEKGNVWRGKIVLP